MPTLQYQVMNYLNEAYQHMDINHELTAPPDGLQFSDRILFLLRQRSMTADQLGIELKYKNVAVILRHLKRMEKLNTVKRTQAFSLNTAGRNCVIWAVIHRG